MGRLSSAEETPVEKVSKAAVFTSSFVAPAWNAWPTK